MSSFALYDHHCLGQFETSIARQISIVLHSTKQDIEELSRAIARHLRENAAPARVVIFGLLQHESFIKELLSIESPFHQRLSVAWGRSVAQSDCFGIVWPDRDLRYRVVENTGITDEQTETEVRHAASMTAQSIFRAAGCVQTAPRGSHYSKTSKAHSGAFIRASNALVKSKNTLTLAYWLLPFVSQAANRILVDTSAIASLVYASCHLAVKAGQLVEMPIIDSFRSYEGLSDEDLEDAKNSLFIISASTSGNLAREAFAKGVDRRRLTTLFLLSSDQPDQDALCYLRRDDGKNPEGFELIPSWKEDECKLCKGGSAPIKIGGDLFLTALPTTEEVLLRKKHLPESQYAVLDRFAGLGIFRAHRKIGDRVSEINVDLAPLINPSSPVSPAAVEFQQDWDRTLRANVAANVSHLVYATYPSSETLSKSLCSYASQFVKSMALTPVAGNSLAQSKPLSNGSAVIVASCIDDPVEMMGINRDLRSVIPGGTAVYVAPFIRATTAAEAQAIRLNLTYGDRGVGTYAIHNMYELYLPEDRDENPWDAELKYLLKLSDWLDDLDTRIPADILSRRALLRASTGKGMVDELFWPDHNGKALRIRSNFVLLPTEDGKRVLNQADIFVVISTLLNHLRHADSRESLRVAQFERRVISPANFVRFNDGVIQAAILRAARGNELNYVAADTDRYSSQMRDVLLQIISSKADDDREALTEFMLAMSVGRLRLEPEDRAQVAQTVIDRRAHVAGVAVNMAEGMLAGIA